MEQAQEGVRINKYLSEAGVCSRREADRKIEAGAVTIDGRIAVAGDRVLEGQQVLVVRMNKNKKFQKEQLSKEGYEEFLEFFKP